LEDFEHRTRKHRVEHLEDRVAPGTLLDYFGLSALGLYPALSSSTDSLITDRTSDAQRRPTARIGSLARDAAHGSVTESVAGTESRADATQRSHQAIANAFDDWTVSPSTAGNDLTTNVADEIPQLESVFLSLGLFSALGIDDQDSGAGDRQTIARGDRSLSMFAGPVSVSKLAGNWTGGMSTPAGAGHARMDSSVLAPTARPNLPTGNGTPEQLDASQDPLPRSRAPHDRVDDPNQSLHPYAITSSTQQKSPANGVVRSPAEYDPMRGVIFSYTSFGSIVTDMVKELTEDPTKDDIAYVVVSSQSQQNSATNSFINAGADMSKVQFFIQPSDSVWIRDYGPHFVTVDDSLSIVDSHYYPSRPTDNFMPTRLGDMNFNIPTFDMGLYYSGGNFQPGPNNSGFTTALVDLDNPTSAGFDAAYIAEVYNKFQGIDTLHVMPKLPFSVDGTGHVDMWLYLVDEDTVMLSEFKPGSNSTAIEITNNAVGYMEDLGFEVFRLPAWNAGGVHYTYTNGFRVNDRILVPVYGNAIKPGGSSSYNDEDAAAMAAWQAAAGPGVEIIPIQSFQIIPSAGAIHCIVMQVPLYGAETPAANVVTPSGGELLVKGTQQTIEWSAIDTGNVDPTEVSIYLSRDGGSTYEHITTTTDTGSYVWTVNGRTTNNAIIKIVATAADNDQVEAFSQPFAITKGPATKYDFSTGAGVDKFAYGWQTSSWTSVNGNLAPVTSQLSAANYAKLATSNATGGDLDANRYVAPSPSSSSESTHVFQFTIAEAARRIAQLDVNWEGYADACTQVELYVWDLVAQNWGDGAGLTGQNRYMDSWAGNADGNLLGSIRSDFSRYVDESGTIRFMVYAERSGDESFHDYMSVTVEQKPLLLAI